MSKEKPEPNCPCWNCMAKDYAKESPMAKTVLHPMNVKAVFLSLKTNKDQNKNKTDATEKGQRIRDKRVLEKSVWQP